MYLTTITIGEIEKGIDLIPWPDAPNEREERYRLQAQLEQKLEALCDRFEKRIVSINIRVARQWGRFHAERQREGRKTPVVDTMIAACAQVHHLAVATADSDFAAFGSALTVYNPRTHELFGHASIADI